MKLWKAIFSAALLLGLCSCNRGEMGYSYNFYDEEEASTDKVVILYAAAANNLSGLIQGNIDDVKSGGLPHFHSHQTILVYSHMNWEDSFLCRWSTGECGQPVCDTLLRIEAGRSAADSRVLNEVLEKVRDEYPEDTYSYTLILSSHSTGWLPSWGKHIDNSSYLVGSRHNVFGPEQYPTPNSTKVSLDIQDLADAIPMKLDCLVFDACLMGCIEVAYQLRNKVEKLCCSPAEVPGTGYVYSSIVKDLLSGTGSPEAFSKAFFDYYDEAQQNGDVYGATSTTVDCSKLEPLAEICTTLFENYRDTLSNINSAQIQHFYRSISSDDSYARVFFDLEDILVHAGITEEEKASLDEALNGCITYKDATASFMPHWGGFDIHTYCGLSMYLPNQGYDALNEFYKTLDWNIATKLVK